MTDMLKKDNEVRWYEYAKNSFNAVKFSLYTPPTLISLNYTSDFIIFSFNFEHTLGVLLMKKRDPRNEQPIDFFSRTTRYVVLKYNIIEK